MTPEQTALSRFMVALTFHDTAGHEAEFAALIPQEQAHIAELRRQGIVEALYISADRAQVWVVMRGAATAEVQNALTSFPLYPYMTATVITLVP